MYTKILVFAFFAGTLAAVGCGGSVPANSSANPNAVSNVNGNLSSVSPVEVNVDPSNMPDGLSADPMRQPANGIGVNANTARPNGATPTPGIPNPADIKRGIKPGTTPTPGIPSAEEMRIMLRKTQKNANINAPAMKGTDKPMMEGDRPAMMKSNKPTGGKPPTKKPTP